MRKKFFSSFIAGITAVIAMTAMTGCNASEKKAVTASTTQPYTKYSAEEEENPDNTSKLDPSLQNVYDNKKLVFGFDTSAVPMSFTDENNEIIGFYVDVAQELCDRMDIGLEKQPVDANKPQAALNDHKVEIIWNSAMSADIETDENVNASKPIAKTEMVFVIPSYSDLLSINYLEGMTIGVKAGSPAQNFLGLSPVFEDIKFAPAENIAAALSDMENGSSDAVFLDTAASNYYIKTLGKNYTQLEGSLEEVLHNVILRKEDITLFDEVQNQLTAMKQDGKLAEISARWFGTDLTNVG